jgi:hypothetical protein
LCPRHTSQYTARSGKVGLQIAYALRNAARKSRTRSYAAEDVDLIPITKGLRIMQLTSKWPGGPAVYWRVFAEGDGAHWVGLADGILKPDQTAVIDTPGHARLQLEVKRDGLLGPVLLAAKRIFEAGSVFEIRANGRVTRTATNPPLALPLRNDLGGPMYWRTFLQSDTTYAAGLAEGVIKAGRSATLAYPGVEALKLELKRTNGIGEHLVRARIAFGRGSSLSMNESGLFDHGNLVELNLNPRLRFRLTSEWSGGPIFWRVFAATDRDYALGLADGILRLGESRRIELKGHAAVQLEIKRDNLVGDFLVRPDRTWRSGADLAMFDEGLMDGNTLVIPAPPRPAYIPLTSNWSHGRLYWRLYGPDDTSYAAPLPGRDGILSYGQTIFLEHGSLTALQLELRRGDLVGQQLIAPGTRWENGASLEMRDAGLFNNGALVAAAPPAPPPGQPPPPPPPPKKELVCELSSSWRATPLFWRVFAPGALVGSAEGVLAAGQRAKIELAGVADFELELRKRDLFGELLIERGTRWPKGTRLSFDAQRRLWPDEPAATSTIQIFLDGNLPFACGQVVQKAGDVTVTHTTDGLGRVAYFGGPQLELRRGKATVCTVPASAIQNRQLRITRAMMSASFGGLRDKLLAKAPQIRAHLNGLLDVLHPRVDLDMANLFGHTDRGLIDYYRPFNTSLQDGNGKDVLDANGQIQRLYVTKHMDHHSSDNPWIMAGSLAFSLCVSRALESTAIYDPPIAALTAFFTSLADPDPAEWPDTPPLRRRITDRRDLVARRKAVVEAEPVSDDRTLELALIAMLQHPAQPPKFSGWVPDEWELEPSLDEYTGMANGLAAIVRLGPNAVRLRGRDVFPSIVARDMLARELDSLARNSYYVKARTHDGAIVMAARGPGALLNASAFAAVRGQLADPRDVLADPEIPLIDYPSLRAATEAKADRIWEGGEGLALCNVYWLALSGQLPGLIAAAVISGPVLVGAAAQLATFLVPEATIGTAAAPLLPPAVLAVVAGAAVLCAPVLAHPLRPSAYYQTLARAMATPLWGFSPWWSSALFDRAAMAGFPSSELARNWQLSLPRQEPNRGYSAHATQLRDCAQLLLTGGLDDPDAFLARILTDLTGADPNTAIEQGVMAWCTACLALGIRPELDWTKYIDSAK